MRSAVAGKPRVHELAKELGSDSKTVLSKLKELGEFVKSASSTVEAPVARRLREVMAAESKGGAAAPAEPAARKAPAQAAPGPRRSAEKAAAPQAPSRPGPSPRPGPRPGPRPNAPVAAKPASAHDIEVAAAEVRAAQLKKDQEAAVKAAQAAAQQRTERAAEHADEASRPGPAGGAPAGTAPTGGT